MSSIAERTMNVEALRSAIRAFAPVQADGIEYLYVLLDDSMRKGYEAGAYDAAQLVEVERDNAWDQGYLDGVEEARRDPSGADCIIQDILAGQGYTAADDEEALEEAWKAYDRQVFSQ